MSPITGPFKPHPHQRVHLTTHFIINPHFSEFIQNMKPAATPLRCSTRNAKDAPLSVQPKALPPSAQALPTKTNKKQWTAPSTPGIAPSPSGIPIETWYDIHKPDVEIYHKYISLPMNTK
jgi:hypothetical protein